jgi:hypothetical protein
MRVRAAGLEPRLKQRAPSAWRRAPSSEDGKLRAKKGDYVVNLLELFLRRVGKNLESATGRPWFP